MTELDKVVAGEKERVSRESEHEKAREPGTDMEDRFGFGLACQSTHTHALIRTRTHFLAIFPGSWPGPTVKVEILGTMPFALPKPFL